MEQETSQFLKRVYILAAILAAAAVIFVFGQIAYQQKYLSLQSQYQVTVSGEGKVYVKPDIATVGLGVTTTGLTTSDVISRNTTKMNVVIQAIKDSGVEDKDIQTTNYSLSPQYNYTEAAGRIFQGYTLEQNLQVKIRDFTKVGDVLQKAVVAGANLTSNLQFTIENPEQFKQEARAKAIEQAKNNAKNLAETSGIALGKIINIYENYAYPVMYNTALGKGGASMDSAVPAPVIQPGQQEIDVTINLTYQVK